MGRAVKRGRGGKANARCDFTDAVSEERCFLVDNELDGKFEASPASSGKDLFLRGHDHLYRLTKS